MKYRFSGHQTFPLRYPWPPKGIRALLDDPSIFFRDEAFVDLGVGKNMVSAIRFWCEALKLAVVDGRAHKGQPTTLGAKLLSPGGWDPYLEYPGTLWLFHWQLVNGPEIASTWYLTFTKWNRDTFTRAELLDWLMQIVEQSDDKRTSKNSLKRDIDVFVRTYVPSEVDKRRPLEDTFDSPLVELGLIRELEDGLYHFNRGPKPTLPDEIFAYALTKYWNDRAREQETLNFERVLYGPSSPGAAFKLSEPALAARLEALPDWTGLHYDETAGLRVLIKENTEQRLQPMECLRRYYEASERQEAA